MREAHAKETACKALLVLHKAEEHKLTLAEALYQKDVENKRLHETLVAAQERTAKVERHAQNAFEWAQHYCSRSSEGKHGAEIFSYMFLFTRK